jgi:GNAT superfamily N-acetyltransferase
MDIKIRDYKQIDKEALKNILLNAENFGEPFLATELLRIDHYQKIPKLGKIKVALDKDNGEILGFIAVEFRWRSFNIETIITHHNHLREGIGRKLIQATIEMALEHSDINVIRVNTGDFMKYAQKFYLACGFQICGFVKHDLSWYNHQVHLVYPLKERIPDLDDT